MRQELYTKNSDKSIYFSDELGEYTLVTTSITWPGLDTVLPTEQAVVEYVTWAISALPTITASNWLTKLLDDIKLGGLLTDAWTVIEGSETTNFQIYLHNAAEDIYAQHDFKYNDVYLYVTDDTASLNCEIRQLITGGYSRLYMNTTDSGWQQGFDIRTDWEFTVLDTLNSKGMIYAADYSANYTARSLVDKEYVDGLIATEKLKDVVTTGITETVSVAADGYIEQTASWITTTLPAGVSWLCLRIANRWWGANIVAWGGTDTIEWAATKAISDGESFLMIYNGSTWRIV